MTITREQQKPATTELEGGSISITATKPRLSCAACSLTAGKLCYPPGPQPSSSINPKRSRPKILAHNHHDHHSETSKCRTLDSCRRSSDTFAYNNNNNISNNNNSLGISSASTSFDGPGFKLDFDSAGSDHTHPYIKCHIHHLDRDLQLDLTLERDKLDNNNGKNLQSSSKFSLNCSNPSYPDKNVRLKVELSRTSAKGFGLKIMQSMPRPGVNNSDSGSVNKKEMKSDLKYEVDSRVTSSSSSQSNDILDFGEVRVSRGKLSKAGTAQEDDNCKGTIPCGAPHC